MSTITDFKEDRPDFSEINDDDYWVEKRVVIATACFQSLIPINSHVHVPHLAKEAVKYADYLIEALRQS